MATPNAVASMMTEQLWSVYDYAKPEVAMELFRTHGYQGLSSLQLLRSMGRERPITQDEWSAYEDDYIVETFHSLGNVGDPGAGVDLTVTLDPADLDADNRFYPRVGYIVTMPNETQGHIYAINTTTPTAPVLTIRPVHATKTLGAVTAGQEISITNGAWGAGTDQPVSAQRGATKRSFVAQIFKESIGAEGTQLVNSTWFSKYDTGENLIGWYSPAYLDAEYRLSLIEDGAYLFGETNTNATLVVPNGEEGAGNTIKTTKGLVPHIRDLGNVFPYVPGTLNVEDFDQVDLYLTQQGVDSPFVMMLNGVRLAHEIENVLVDFNKDTGVDFTRVTESVFKGNDKLAVSVNFQMLTKGNRTFLFKRMDNFSNPKTFGATGYDMDKYGLVLPLTSMKDPKSGEKLQNLESCYRALGGYSRRYEVFTIGGAGGGGRYVTSVDKTNTFLRGHHGLQAMKVNQMMMFDPS